MKDNNLPVKFVVKGFAPYEAQKVEYVVGGVQGISISDEDSERNNRLPLQEVDRSGEAKDCDSEGHHRPHDPPFGRLHGPGCHRNHGPPHGPPRSRSNSPGRRGRQVPPQGHHGPPHERHGPPHGHHGPPRSRSNSPGRRGRQVPPQGHHGPPHERHGPPHGHHGPPRSRSNSPGRRGRQGPPHGHHGPPHRDRRHGPPPRRGYEHRCRVEHQWSDAPAGLTQFWHEWWHGNGNRNVQATA